MGVAIQVFKRVFVLVTIIAVMITAQGAMSLENDLFVLVSREAKILKALSVLEGTSEEYVLDVVRGDNLSGMPINIQFTRLGEIAQQYKSFHAVTYTDEYGRINMLIDARHQEAIPEALACLIVHESIHQDNQSSIEEEIYAWTKEATTWHFLKQANPTLLSKEGNECSLIKRLDTLEKLYLEGDKTAVLIREKVETNLGYQHLPLISVGYGLD